MGLPQQLHQRGGGGRGQRGKGGWDRRVSVNKTTKLLTRKGKGKTAERLLKLGTLVLTRPCEPICRWREKSKTLMGTLEW